MSIFLPLIWRQQVPPTYWSQSTKLYGVTYQKTVVLKASKDRKSSNISVEISRNVSISPACGFILQLPLNCRFRGIFLQTEAFYGSSYHASCRDKERNSVWVIEYNPIIRNVLPSDVHVGSGFPTGFEMVTDICHDTCRWGYFTLQKHWH